MRKYSCYLVVLLVALQGCLSGQKDSATNSESEDEQKSGFRVELIFEWDSEDGRTSRAVRVDLCPGQPNHSLNFLETVKSGYYNQTPIHQIILNRAIMGGDFTHGDGSGGHAITYHGLGDQENSETWLIPPENNTGFGHDTGVITTIRGSDEPAGSQWMILSTNWDGAELNDSNSPFGRVSDPASQTTVDIISEMNPGVNNRPRPEVNLTSAVATEIDIDTAWKACIS